MRKRFATISDVARDAELSTATVSRALNQPWRVNETTRERVRLSISRLGYRPDMRARLLARGSNGGTLCFLLSNRRFVHSFHSQILEGAANAADVERVQVLYATCMYSPSARPDEIELPRILGARGIIDGVIVAGTNYPNIFPVLNRLKLPHVVFGTNLVAREDTVTSAAVYADDQGGGYQATRHLIDLGHRKIRFIGDVSLPWYRRRYLGYVSAMALAGLACEPPVGSAFDGEMEMGSRAACDLCDRGMDFTALFVGGDRGAVGAMRALRARGVDVPGQVSVVGFNDEEAARMCEPPLTTVSVPNEQIGAECVRILQTIIAGSDDAPEQIVLPTALVVRQSTRKEPGVD